MDKPVKCYTCGKELKTIKDYKNAERVEIDPAEDKFIWFCEKCKAGEENG